MLKPKTNKVVVSKRSIRDNRKNSGAIKPIQNHAIEEIILKDFGPYERQEVVDFDVAICISSYERYYKIKSLLSEIFSQPSIYTYKVFVINDGSSQGGYKRLTEKFPEIEFIENEVNGGKEMYWNTVSRVWGLAKKYKFQWILFREQWPSPN